MRFTSIQLLRGAAACVVAAMHIADGNLGSSPSAGWLMREITLVLLSMGGAGVDLFFVLSGFVIYAVALRSTSGPPVARCVAFLTKRALRIYPLFWLTLAAQACALLSAGYDPGRIRAAFHVQVLALATISIPVLGPAWTLVFELWFYLGIALILLLPAPRVGSYIAVWAFAQTSLILLNSLQIIGFQFSVLTHPQVLEFFAGCAAARLSQSVSITHNAFVGLLLAALSVFGAGSLIALNRLPYSALSDFERLVFYGCPAVLLTTALVCAEKRSPLIRVKRLSRLGDISYSIYLWHYPVKTFAYATGLYVTGTVYGSALNSIAEFAATLLVAEVSFRLVETPSILLGHRCALAIIQAGNIAAARRAA